MPEPSALPELDDIAGFSDEQLADLIDTGEMPTTEKSEDEQSSVEAAEQATETEQTEDETPEVEAEEQKADDADAEQPEVTEQDEISAQLDLQDAQIKKLHSLLGRRAGEDDFHRKRSVQLERENAELRAGRQAPADDAEYDDPPPRPAPQVVQPQGPSDNEVFLSSQAVEGVFGNFINSSADLAVTEQNGQKSYSPELLEQIATYKQDLAELATMGNARDAAEGAKRIFDYIGDSLREFNKARRLEDIKRARADQTEKRKAEKIAQSASSADAATQLGGSDEISIDDLSEEDIKKLIDRY